MTVLNFPEILQRNNELILTELQYESDMLMKYIKLHAYEEKIAELLLQILKVGLDKGNVRLAKSFIVVQFELIDWKFASRFYINDKINQDRLGMKKFNVLIKFDLGSRADLNRLSADEQQALKDQLIMAKNTPKKIIVHRKAFI